MEETEDKAKIQEVAHKVELLLAFCADLIPDKELIRRAGNRSREIQSFALAAAPLLVAVGENYEAHEMEASIRANRAEAIYHLVNVLDTTEKQRQKFKEENAGKAHARHEILKAMGAI